MTTKAEITQTIAVLGVLYPRNALAGEELKRAVSAWYQLLSDVPFYLLSLDSTVAENQLKNGHQRGFPGLYSSQLGEIFRP